MAFRTDVVQRAGPQQLPEDGSTEPQASGGRVGGGERDADLRARIDALERECGCEPSAVAGFAAVLVYAAALVVLGPWISGWPAIGGIGFLFFAFAVLAARALALRRARRRRDVLVTQLETTEMLERAGRAPVSTGDLH